MESVEFIYSCADCGFQTINEFLLDDHLESYHSNRMPNGPNIIHEIFPNAREQFSINTPPRRGVQIARTTVPYSKVMKI